MTASRIDVLGIGNAIVDVIAEVDDAFLDSLGLVKGSMRLVEHEEATRIAAMLASPALSSGGSAANTIAGLAAAGGRGCFVGKVAADSLGRAFADDLHDRDVVFATAAADDGPETGRCLVLVTPDGERTMCTWLGASTGLGTGDLDAGAIARSSVLYLEGYLWDSPEGPAVFSRAAAMAAGAGCQVAMTLSDSFCVDRHRDNFRAFLARHVDIAFANEAEALSLARESSLAAAAAYLAGLVGTAVVTRSEKGSMVVRPEGVVEVEAVGTRVVDMTGAGDLYAAGYLLGCTRSTDPERAARIASVCAADVISRFGARVDAGIRSRIAGMPDDID